MSTLFNWVVTDIDLNQCQVIAENKVEAIFRAEKLHHIKHYFCDCVGEYKKQYHITYNRLSFTCTKIEEDATWGMLWFWNEDTLVCSIQLDVVTLKHNFESSTYIYMDMNDKEMM